MKIRSNKRHQLRTSGKAERSVLVLASRLQRFLSTGRATKKDLRDIDLRITTFLSDEGRKALEFLKKLEDRIPILTEKEKIQGTSLSISKWVEQLESEDVPGYCNVQVKHLSRQKLVLEEIADMDGDIARMISSVNERLESSLSRSSYEIPKLDEIAKSCAEVINAYGLREKLLCEVSAA